MDGLAIFLSAFLVGLLGASHCIGMCGGIVGTLSVSSNDTGQPLRLMAFLSAYNFGRIASYTLVGAVAGGLGSSLVETVIPLTAARWLTVVFMFALGAYLLGWRWSLLWAERLGTHIWRHIAPLAGRVLPVKSPIQALGLGFLWGWLPCGMVYSVLVWAMASGSATQGALLMLAFGLGTLPSLILLGSATKALLGWAREPRVRVMAGVSILLMGVSLVFDPLSIYAGPLVCISPN